MGFFAEMQIISYIFIFPKHILGLFLILKVIDTENWIVTFLGQSVEKFACDSFIVSG